MTLKHAASAFFWLRLEVCFCPERFPKPIVASTIPLTQLLPNTRSKDFLTVHK
jgi:hypothetical protein